MGAGALLRSLTLVIVMTLFVAACTSDEPASGTTLAPTTTVADDTPKEGPVTIVTEVYNSAGAGTFEVTEGADVLGCSSGTFRDHGGPPRIMICDFGISEGSFSVTRPPFASIEFDFTGPYPTVENGTWSVVDGSGVFVGLQGGGEWSAVFATGPDDGVGTWTGDISYTS
jgi:hypothetical protein